MSVSNNNVNNSSGYSTFNKEWVIGINTMNNNNNSNINSNNILNSNNNSNNSNVNNGVNINHKSKPMSNKPPLYSNLSASLTSNTINTIPNNKMKT